MTLATTTRLVSYNGTGTVGPFPYPFLIFDAADLLVTHIDVTGVETELVLAAHYTVTGVKNRSGGAVTLTIPLAVGETLIIERVVPLVQPTSFRTENQFFAAKHEDAFDRVTMGLQQHGDGLARAIQMHKLSAADTTFPLPDANKVIGWNSAADALVNQTPVAGPVGSRGPAGLGGPIPIVTDDADRDAQFPVPATDNAVWNKARGTVQRFGAPSTGANRWLSSGIMRNAGPVISAASKGAYADGVHDDQPFLSAMDVAQAAIGRSELDPGTYLINSNLTLSSHLMPLRGALLSPAADVKVTILGNVTAGSWQFLDFSRGGTFSFVGNRAIHVYNPAWFGVVGDDTVDDMPHLTDMVNSVDDYITAEFPPRLIMRLANEWRIENRAGMWFKSTVLPFPNAVAPAPQFTWDGHQGFVRTDGAMVLNSFTLNSAGATFTANMVNSSIWVVGAGAFGSALRTTVAQYVSPTQIVLSQKAQTAVTGAEFHIGAVMIFMDRCINCRFTGFAIWADQNLFVPTRPYALTVFDIDHWTNGFEWRDAYETCTSITAGTSLVTSSRAAFRRSQVRSTITIPGAGIAGADLPAQITRWISVTQVKIAVAASTTVNNVTAVVSGQYGYGSECHLDWNFIGRNKGHKDSNLVSLSTTAQNNQEYHIVEHNVFQGNSGAQLNDNGTKLGNIASGTAVFTTDGFAFFDPVLSVGKRIRIDNAGAPVGPLATALDTTILSIGGGGTIANLAANAGATVTHGPWMYDEGLGSAVKNGSSFNAKRQMIYFNTMHNLRTGITSLAGSIISDMNNFTFNEIDHELLGSSEPSSIFRSNSEASRQHLVTAQADPVTLIGCRMAPYWGKPNGGYIEPFIVGFNSGPVSIESCLFDQTPRPGCAIFDLGGAGKFNNILTIRNCRFNFITEAQLFRQYGGGGWTVIREGLKNINGVQPARWMQGNADLLVEALGVNTAAGFASNAAITGRNRPLNGALDAIGVQGDADSDAVGGNRLIGVKGRAGKLSTRTQFTTEFVGVEAELPTITGDPTALGTGVSVVGPIVASGTLALARGVRIALMKQGGVTAGVGITQEGASDTNLLAGDTSFGSGMVEKATIYIDISAGGNATPNSAGAMVYRYRMAGAATVNDPLNLVKGRRLKLIMFNNTGGPITPTLGGKFLVGFGAIAAGKSRSRQYIYDDVLDKLEPIGAVSEDF
jgi:hypothetical protein